MVAMRARSDHWPIEYDAVEGLGYDNHMDYSLEVSHVHDNTREEYDLETMRNTIDRHFALGHWSHSAVGHPETTAYRNPISAEDYHSRASSGYTAVTTKLQPSALEAAEAAHDKPPPNPMDPKLFPDGGLKAWSTVLGGFFGMFVTFGWINCIGVFQTYYESQPLKKYSPSDIAWIPAMEIFMLLFTGPIVGRTFDNHGPAGLLFTGTLFHFLGLILISFCKEYYQFFLAQGMCSPLGASMVFYSSTNATNTWFLRRRALATGIVFSGSSLGGVILPIMVQRLIPQIGFPWTLRAAAFLILGCLIICNLTIRSRVPPTKKPFKIMDFIEPFQERTYVLLNFACFFAFWGVFIPFAFVILQGLGHGMSPRLAQYLVPILNAASIFGRILPGFIGDIFGRFNAMIVMTGFSVIVILALWIPATTNASTIVFAILYGFGSGAVVALPSAMIAQISDVRKIGTRIGTLYACSSFAVLTGSPIGGALVTAQGGRYTHVQVFTGIIMAVGCAFFIAARISLGGTKLLKKV